MQSILLWAAAAMIVPVVIHLWNIRQGKTLKIGSIALITESAKSQAKSFKITQWLLLLLRCLLIITLAMLIAQPYLNKTLNGKEKGWIVVDQNGFKKAYSTYHSIIDSLQKNGYSLHYFDENFGEGNLKDTLKITNDTISKSSLSYWTLLKALNEKVPANLPVYLFTDNYLQHFSGNRPEVSLNLKWFTYPSVDIAETWLASAYKTSNDSIRVVVGNSNASGTYYTYQNLSFNDANKNYTISSNKGKTVVVSNDALHQTTYADTATIIIVIYTNKFFADADYLKAALYAIEDVTQQKMQVVLVNNATSIPANYNWLFWLSDETLPTSLIKNNILMYEKGKAQNSHSVLLTGDETALTTTEAIIFYQYIKNDSFSFQPVWKNGLNEPVLTVQKNGASVYRFYSRFNPQWSDLVWSRQFPQVLYKLLFDEADKRSNVKDKRIIDVAQMQPQIVAAQTYSNKEAEDKNDLSHLFWLVAFLLFLAERIVSFKQAKAAYE